MNIVLQNNQQGQKKFLKKKVTERVKVGHPLIIIQGITLVIIFIKHCNKALFPSFQNCHFQNKAKCKFFYMEMSFTCKTTNFYLHIRDFALSLVLADSVIVF